MNNEIQKRYDLHRKMETLLGVNLTNVYFQAPEETKLRPPYLVYEKTGIENKYANNVRYMSATEYTVTLVETNPDSDVALKILDMFKSSKFLNKTKINGLYHTRIRIYY